MSGAVEASRDEVRLERDDTARHGEAEHKSTGKLVRLALFGLPGAGKSTSCSLLLAMLRESGRRAVVIKLAEPLYEVQSLIYSYCGMPRHERYAQDGVLLNFLGANMRRINPNVLTEHFAQRLRAVEAERDTGVDTFVLCDDMRPIDAPFMREQGFDLIRIDATTQLRALRLGSRGDVTRGSDDHSTELGIEGVVPDQVVANTGTLGDLQSCLRGLIGARL